MLRKAILAIAPMLAVAYAMVLSDSSSNSAVDFDNVVASSNSDTHVQPVYWDSRYGSTSWRDYGGRGGWRGYGGRGEYRYFGFGGYGGSYRSYRTW